MSNMARVGRMALFGGSHNKNHLDRFAGGQDGDLRKFLIPFAFGGYRFRFDDFEGPALDVTNDWLITTDTGGTAFAKRTNDSPSLIRGVVNAVSGDGIGIRGDRNWLGDKNCWMEVRFRMVTSVADYALELGLVDVLTDFGTLGVTDIDVPTVANGAADIAAFIIDKSQTLVTAAFVTDGSTTGYNTTKTNLGTFAPAADTFVRVRVGLEGDTSYCVVDGDPVLSARHGDTAASKVEGGVNLRPYLVLITRAAAAKTIDIDYIAVGADR